MGQLMMERSATGGRRVDLDWVRIAAFALLILYHVGMLYVPWYYHVKSTYRITGLEPAMLALNPWRLGLLFLVSGAATRFMAANVRLGALLGRRTVRLLVPLVFGVLVIVPPQSYLEVVSRQLYAGDFPTFYTEHYFTFGPAFCSVGRCLTLPTWNHLWFVAYLWVYTVALVLFVALLPGVVRSLEAGLVRALSGIGVVALPMLPLALYRLILFPVFPQTNMLSGDWYNHALYFSLFACGFLIARAEPVWASMVRWRWAALGLAAAVFASYLVVRASTQAGAPGPVALQLYGRIAYGVYQWGCIVAALGFARRWITWDGPARRYLTDAVFPYYIVHQTAIVVSAYALNGAGLSVGVEAGLVIAATAVSCAVTYEVVRRVVWLRPLFGLKWQSQAGPGFADSTRQQPESRR
jgi:hypothetical protein